MKSHDSLKLSMDIYAFHKNTLSSITDVDQQLEINKKRINENLEKNLDNVNHQIRELQQYKTEYQSYIDNVHSNFERKLSVAKKDYAQSIKSNYEDIRREISKAEKDFENDPLLRVRFIPFNFWDDLKYSVISSNEEKGKLKGLVNFMIAVSYTVAIVAALAFTMMCLTTVFIPYNPITYLLQENLDKIQPPLFATAFFIFNIFILGLRLYNRYQYSADNERSSDSLKDSMAQSRDKKIQEIKERMKKYREANFLFFSNNEYVEPSLSLIILSKANTMRILEEVIKTTPSNYKKSVFDQEYTFQLSPDSHY